MSAIACIVLIIVLLAATICEKITEEISVWIWVFGGVVGSVLNYLGYGGVSLKVGILTSVGIYLLGLVFSASLRNAIGGGLIKGFSMCGVYFGVFTIITMIIWAVSLGFAGWIHGLRKKDSIPGDTLTHGMPFLLFAVLATVVYLIVKGLM